jgi:hypothetical protein
MKKATVILSIALCMCACASVGVQVVKEQSSKQTDCKIDVYTSENEIKREYETLCLIDSKTGSTLFDKKTIAAAIDIAKPKACKCGADALLVMSADRRGVSVFSWGDAKTVLKGIKYK